MQSEAELLVLAAQEDEHLYLARALEANMGMLVERASVTHVSGLEHEEVMSEMKLSAIEAIRTYEPAKGVWSSWLHLRLRHKACWLIRQRQNKLRYKMDNTLEYEHDKHTLSYEEVHWGDDWPIAGLTVAEGAVLELHYLHRHTLKHIGRIMGCCHQQACNKMHAAIERAQEIMERCAPKAVLR